MVTGRVWGPSNKQIFPGGGGGGVGGKGSLRRAVPPRSSNPEPVEDKNCLFRHLV